jgi:hypothetical protein
MKAAEVEEVENMRGAANMREVEAESTRGIKVMKIDVRKEKSIATTLVT